MKKKLLSLFLGMWMAVNCLPMMSAAADDPSMEGESFPVLPAESRIEEAGEFASTPKGENAELNVAGSSFLLGDVDGNGVVDARDRMLLNRFLMRSKFGEVDIEKAAADINGDHWISELDATILERYLANWGGEYEEYFHPTYPEYDLSPETVYRKMIALKNEYYEGRPWTNNNQYVFTHYPPYSTYTGQGCVAFALILSDAAFGELPARRIDKGGFAYSDLRPGDILRVDNNSHTVIILQVFSDHIEIAEGNYASSIHWGRTIDKQTVMNTTDYILTRYPD